MSDISGLESRIAAALDRIGRGIEAQAPVSEPDSVLQERLASQQTQLQALDVELQRLRASNTQLRALNTQLRNAVTEGLSPQLIDVAVAAEVEALHAQRTADAAEVDAILAELKPLIEESTNAAG